MDAEFSVASPHHVALHMTESLRVLAISWRALVWNGDYEDLVSCQAGDLVNAEYIPHTQPPRCHLIIFTHSSWFLLLSRNGWDSQKECFQNSAGQGLHQEWQPANPAGQRRHGNAHDRRSRIREGGR